MGVRHAHPRAGFALASAAALLSVGLIGLGAGAAPASAADKDCADFKTQKRAQRFFKEHHPKRDPHGLDADRDGIACESNPCPCKGKASASRVDVAHTADHRRVPQSGQEDSAEFWTRARMQRAEPVLPSRTPAPATASRSGVKDSDRQPFVVPPKLPHQRDVGTASRSTVVRTEVDPTIFPNTTQGKLFFRFRGALALCSATVVNSENQRVVFTAGHCLRSENRRRRWSRSVVFVPGYQDGARPFGEFPADVLWIAKGWARYRFNNNDIGAVLLSPNAAGQTVVDAAGGARGFTANAPRGQVFEVFGYPAAPPFTGERLWRCDSPYLGSTFFQYPGPPQLVVNCDLTGGASGGGWIIGGTQLNSVTSFGDENELTGPYFGSQAVKLFNKVRFR